MPKASKVYIALFILLFVGNAHSNSETRCALVADQSISNPAEFTFRASAFEFDSSNIASFIPSGTINFGDGTSQTMDITLGSGQGTKHAYPGNATSNSYTATLTVTDSKGATASCTNKVSYNFNQQQPENTGPNACQNLSVVPAPLALDLTGYKPANHPNTTLSAQTGMYFVDFMVKNNSGSRFSGGKNARITIKYPKDMVTETTYTESSRREYMWWADFFSHPKPFSCAAADGSNPWRYCIKYSEAGGAILVANGVYINDPDRPEYYFPKTTIDGLSGGNPYVNIDAIPALETGEFHTKENVQWLYSPFRNLANFYNSFSADIFCEPLPPIQPPVFEDFAVSTEKNAPKKTEPLNGHVSSVADKSVLRYYIPSGGLSPYVICSVEGQTLAYTPSTDFTGTTTCTVAADELGSVDYSTVTINVALANSPPIFEDFSLTMPKNSAKKEEELNRHLTDENPAAAVYGVLTENQAEVDCEINGKKLEYMPAADFFGIAQCVLNATDDAGLSDTATVTINVLAPAPGPSCNLHAAVNNNSGEVTFTADAHDSQGTAINSGSLDFEDGTPMKTFPEFSSGGGQIGYLHTYSDKARQYTAQLSVTDTKGAQGTCSTNIAFGPATPANQFCDIQYTANPAGSRTIAFTLTAKNPDGTYATATFDYGDGSPTESINQSVSNQTTHTYSGTQTSYNAILNVSYNIFVVGFCQKTINLSPTPVACASPNTCTTQALCATIATGNFTCATPGDVCCQQPNNNQNNVAQKTGNNLSINVETEKNSYDVAETQKIPFKVIVSRNNTALSGAKFEVRLGRLGETPAIIYSETDPQTQITFNSVDTIEQTLKLDPTTMQTGIYVLTAKITAPEDDSKADNIDRKTITFNIRKTSQAPETNLILLMLTALAIITIISKK